MKVLKNFRCKNTGEIILAGEEFESADIRRIESLVKKGFVDADEPIPSAELTKKDIMALLDEKGIEYNPRDKKDELIELLGGDNDVTGS